jgi:nickel transport protein
MPRYRTTAILFLACLAFSGSARAHFQEIIPHTDIVTGQGDRDLALDLIFGHPMEGGTMEMAKPRGFGYLLNGVKNDLLESLSPFTLREHQAWKASFRANRPGDHVFYVEPAPYWEPAEEVMIVHYAKVVVNAMGKERGWDREVGLPAEIVPQVRPYGLWTGNLFQGVVKKDGEPVPGADIEIEYLNRDGKVSIPSGPFVAQTIRANERGEFCYGIPREGWWGFAALLDNDMKMENPDGEMVDVELGAVMWIHAVDMK